MNQTEDPLHSFQHTAKITDQFTAFALIQHHQGR